MGFDLALNDSLVQEIYPLEDWEVAVSVIQICVCALLVTITREFWISVGRKSTKLVRIAVLSMCICATIYTIPNICATFQVGSPSFVAYIDTQLIYGFVLSSSYLLLYAKQDLLFRSGISEILKPMRRRQRKMLLVVYVFAFLFYWVIGVLALIDGTRVTVVYETETTQYIRVQYYHHRYMMVGLAAADFVMSAVCVLLFVILVLEFVATTRPPNGRGRIGLMHKVIEYKPPKWKSLSNSLETAAYQNMKWSIVGCGSTTLYLVFAWPLVRKYNTLWNALGAVDVCIKVWSLRMMFSQPCFVQTHNCCKSGRPIFFQKSRQVVDDSATIPKTGARAPTNECGTFMISENAMDEALRQQNIDA